VFANAGGEHGILDLLTVTRSGRLAVLELKATEHIHLPLQSAGYWLRIRRHLADEDFSRYGYFTGITLQPAPPLVYLVAPLLRFHRCAAPLPLSRAASGSRRPGRELAQRPPRRQEALDVVLPEIHKARYSIAIHSILSTG
jgi:hypothetical protein